MYFNIRETVGMIIQEVWMKLLWTTWILISFFMKSLANNKIDKLCWKCLALDSKFLVFIMMIYSICSKVQYNDGKVQYSNPSTSRRFSQIINHFFVAVVITSSTSKRVKYFLNPHKQLEPEFGWTETVDECQWCEVITDQYSTICFISVDPGMQTTCASNRKLWVKFLMKMYFSNLNKMRMMRPRIWPPTQLIILKEVKKYKSRRYQAARKLLIVK